MLASSADGPLPTSTQRRRWSHVLRRGARCLDSACLDRDVSSNQQLEQVQPEPPTMVVHDVGHLPPRRAAEQRHLRATEHRGGRRRQQPLVLVVRRLRSGARRNTPGLTLSRRSCSRGREPQHLIARQRRHSIARNQLAAAHHLRHRRQVHPKQVDRLTLGHPSRDRHGQLLTGQVMPMDPRSARIPPASAPIPGHSAPLKSSVASLIFCSRNRARRSRPGGNANGSKPTARIMVRR